MCTYAYVHYLWRHDKLTLKFSGLPFCCVAIPSWSPLDVSVVSFSCTYACCCDSHSDPHVDGAQSTIAIGAAAAAAAAGTGHGADMDGRIGIVRCEG